MKKLLLSTFFLVTSICSAGVIKRPNGVVVQRGDVTICVDVVTESILHVTKTKAGEPIDSLLNYVTVLEPQHIKWSERTKKGVTTIMTPKLVAIIDQDGLIEYRKKGGDVLLTESSEGTWIDTRNRPFEPISQGFVVGDEAIYGLGQYQSGIMNLNSVPVRMAQFNQEIVVPFIVSTNNYGIYWHNYSVTDFNKPQNEIQFNTTKFTVENTQTAQRNEEADKEDVANQGAKRLNENVRTTTFTPTKSGQYTFLLESDPSSRKDADIKLIIGGDTIINYSTTWAPACYSGIKRLDAGKEYVVTLQNNGSKTLGRVLYNEPDFNKTTFTSRSGSSIDYYFVYGNSPAKIVANYQSLTGKAPMFPKKSYGFWHCRERFHNQDELLENAREYRSRQIPIDNIVQDWYYWPAYTKGPEWDRKKYPDPKAMVDELDSLNLNFMVSVWPMVNNTPLTDKYDVTKYKLERGNHYLDFYREEVRKTFYRMLSDSMFHIGVESIWLDGTEPEGVPMSSPTVVGEFGKVSNSYSLLVSKAMYDGQREEFPDRRVFNLTRSAFSGQQRYATATWSGDVAGTWEQFAEQIPAGLNISMAGIPYWTHDIGGFFRDSRSMNPIYDNQYTNPEYLELLSRWFQFGAFSPIFRLHGYVSKTEVWRYGAEFERLARKYINLRYALMPYIYSQAWKVTNESHLMMAPLAYYYPNDKCIWEIKDQYFFGESIMVCPVVEYKLREREVYLPAGEWFDFWSGERFIGGKSHIVPAQLDKIPLFVKAGSIVPMGEQLQYATQKSKRPIILKIYGGADAVTNLYFDDNESYDYEQGKYSDLKVNYDDSKKSVKIELVEDNYIDFAKNPMEFVIENVETGLQQAVIFNSEIIKLSLK